MAQRVFCCIVVSVTIGEVVLKKQVSLKDAVKGMKKV